MVEVADTALLKIIKERFYVDGGDVRWKVGCGRFPEGRVAGCVVRRGNDLRYRYILFRVDGVRMNLLAHRIACIIRDGSIARDAVVDHLDGNGLNNSFENIRVTTYRNNGLNKHRPRLTKHGLVGVQIRPNGWRCRLARKHLGTFPTASAAVNKYWSAMKDLDPEGYVARECMMRLQESTAKEIDGVSRGDAAD